MDIETSQGVIRGRALYSRPAPYQASLAPPSLVSGPTASTVLPSAIDLTGPQSGLDQSNQKINLSIIFKTIAPEKFTGLDRHQDLDDWVTQLLHILRLAKISETLWLDTAAACLSGPASKAAT